MTTMIPPASDGDIIEGEEKEKEGFKGLVQVFRVFKLARILKLARHSKGLQSIEIGRAHV